MTDHENPLFAAIYDPATALAEATVLAPHRRYLTNGLAGRVLDLGTGTGASFPFLVAARDDARRADDDLDAHLLDPDRHMLSRARRAARTHGLDATVVCGVAESLPYPDDSFDAVLSALVGCTVPDLDAALDEVGRVLRPGGQFRFFEHVAADGLQGRVQTAIDPAWTRLAAGCHLDRDLEAAYRAHPGLDVRTVERRDGVPPVSPLVRGVAVATE
ncbi:class I SAM-dependent methyltransferase [Halorubellus sp. PRR65]|uniref:class I SAM-dependent methyltransferase n=1 Tax=Halorubellus sp. PRR65 TaxID=3098148 RepID=UPI002B25A48F|nr:class I SAM-dependent methyltransferase [Halorubellus sp. PRR65]